MPRTIKDRFESFLCERNDAIDNSAYALAVSVVKDDPDATPTEMALEMMTTMKFGDKDIADNHPMLAELIDKTTQILTRQGHYDPACGKVDADVADEDALEWDMQYIGEIADVAETILLNNDFPTCHPYYAGEEGETMCIYCDDCPNTCSFKTADDYEDGKSNPDRD